VCISTYFLAKNIFGSFLIQLQGFGAELKSGALTKIIFGVAVGPVVQTEE